MRVTAEFMLFMCRNIQNMLWNTMYPNENDSNIILFFIIMFLNTLPYDLNAGEGKSWSRQNYFNEMTERQLSELPKKSIM